MSIILIKTICEKILSSSVEENSSENELLNAARIISILHALDCLDSSLIKYLDILRWNNIYDKNFIDIVDSEVYFRSEKPILRIL